MEEQSLRTKRLFGIVLLTVTNAGCLWLLLAIGFFRYAIIAKEVGLERAQTIAKNVDQTMVCLVFAFTAITFILNYLILRFMMKMDNPIRKNLILVLVILVLFITCYWFFRQSFLDFNR